MRNLLTGLLTLLFVAGFCTFFLLDSLLRFAGDPQRVVAAARAANLRGAVVDAASELAAREVNAEGGRVEPATLRPAIADVVSQRWFDDTLESAHGALVAAVDEAEAGAVYDLRPVAAELRRAVDALAERAAGQCEAFLGAAACRDREAAGEAIALQRVRAHNAIAGMPRRVDVATLLDRTAPDGHRLFERAAVRERLGDLRALRWLALALLVGCLALIAFVNLGSTSRALGACASALVAASVATLVVVYAARGPVGERVTDELAAMRSRSDLDRPSQTLAAGLDRFALRAVDAATGGSTGTVAFLGVVGLGLGVASLAAGSSGRRRPY